MVFVLLVVEFSKVLKREHFLAYFLLKYLWFMSSLYCSFVCDFKLDEAFFFLGNLVFFTSKE
jgi:hypothetical protein